MSKSNENKLVPRLRFPDFMNKGEWEEKALKNISEVIMGSSPSSSSYNENKNGLPLLQGNADIKNRKSAPRIYTSEVTKECQIGDILLSVRAPVGTVAKSLHKACIGRGIAAIRAIHNNSQEFLYQWLFSYESSWKNVSQGGTFDAVNSDDVRNLKLPIPASQEQQKIASCLSSLDEVITAESQKLEVLKEHKKGLLQKLLHQEIRFKREDGNSFSDWKEVNFTDCCELAHGFQFREDHFTEKGIPIIKIGSLIDNGCLSFKNATYVDEKYKDEFLKFKLKKGDILMALTGGTLGKVSKISKDYGLIFQNYRVGKFEPKQNAIKDYIYYVLQSTLVQDKVKSLVNEAAQPNLGKQDFDKIEFELPSVDEQQKIASFLSSLDEMIQAQAEKIELLKQHKKGLLQGLFPKMND